MALVADDAAAARKGGAAVVGSSLSAGETCFCFLLRAVAAAAVPFSASTLVAVVELLLPLLRFLPLV